ncbi:MAG TPA: GWxTD domain-containing protein [candidate division WOR-3 bacterium]|uniref:GWxTD domain-containing protein n=1 Tax=candidate division WOR-3 bacterium TaxID=2052148 RepID=A0A7V0T4P5_UNCW3|nr:GWxTD domain-containing protein [candidate division WOR-3 bacterium]
MSVFAVLFCLATAASAGPRLSVDWAAFAGSGDSTRVEVFYAVPYGMLDYSEFEGGLEAMFAVRFELRGTGFEQEATLYRRAAIESFAAAEAAKRSFVDGFSLAVLPGRYSLRVTLLGLDEPAEAEEPGMVELDAHADSISVPAFTGRPDLSTLQLAAGIIHDTVTGGFSVVPNPARSFGGDGAERVFFYCEGYNLSAAADSYNLKVAIVRAAAPETLVASPQTRFKGARVQTAAALGLSVAGLVPGDYRLAVVLDDRATGARAERSARFRIAGEEEERASGVTYRLQMTQLEAHYHDRLEFIASPRELAYYEALSDSGKQVFLTRFWSRHNLAEFARRMETARERYRVAGTDGIRTDRGRIYIKYGEPDGIERREIEVDRRPREYWRYFNQGYAFVFVDVTGSNDYRLVWTNSPDETRTGYESMLTPDEQEMFR